MTRQTDASSIFPSRRERMAVVVGQGLEHKGGNLWTAELPATLSSEADSEQHPTRSPWRLLENGRPLETPHALHAEILSVGGGRYSHWLDTLYFSTSDNTDPRTN